MRLGHAYHDDIQGIVATALAGVTQYTFRQYRNTGIVYPHVREDDVFSHTIQFSHRKKLGANADGIHAHIIPIASANGDIQIDFAWGWYNPVGDTVPDTLPNTGSVVIPLVTTDQYKTKIVALLSNLTPPANEGYSSLLLAKFTRVAPVGTNWGAANEIALVSLDAHMPVDRYGSYNELNDG